MSQLLLLQGWQGFCKDSVKEAWVKWEMVSDYAGRSGHSRMSAADVWLSSMCGVCVPLGDCCVAGVVAECW